MCDFSRKFDFTILAENLNFYGFGRKNRFCNFGRWNLIFTVWTGENSILRFWRKNWFYGFDGKTRFYSFSKKKLDLVVLTGKLDFMVLTEKLKFYSFGGKLDFAVLAKYVILRFFRDNLICIYIIKNQLNLFTCFV